jgi:2-oxo-3-(phosphooxy)propyl 3-oxoalkanoate synthase
VGVQVEFDRILPKALVHKWSIDQVLLTDYQPASRTETVLAAQLPRSHGLYCENLVEAGNPDIAALIEICRQACFVVAHTQYGVPLQGNHYQFLFQELDAVLLREPVDLRSGPPRVGEPMRVVAKSTVGKEWKRGATTSGLHWAFSLETPEGAPLAQVGIRQTWIERGKWREMREVMRRDRGLPGSPSFEVPPPSRLTPSQVGRSNPQNLVLQDVTGGDGHYLATPRVDIRHPVLFDHSIDHIYAMVQTEASRQLALYAVADALGWPVSQLEVWRCQARFVSVAEFDVSTAMQAKVEPSDQDGRQATVSITFSQHERRVSSFEVGVRCCVS